jgi:hypothetical protein
LSIMLTVVVLISLATNQALTNPSPANRLIPPTELDAHKSFTVDSGVFFKIV